VVQAPLLRHDEREAAVLRCVSTIDRSLVSSSVERLCMGAGAGEKRGQGEIRGAHNREAARAHFARSAINAHVWCSAVGASVVRFMP